MTMNRLLWIWFLAWKGETESFTGTVTLALTLAVGIAGACRIVAVMWGGAQ